MATSRSEEFKDVLSKIHVTGAVKPGYFDDSEDPIKSLYQMQVGYKNIAARIFDKSGVDPKHLKTVNTIVLHGNGISTGNGIKSQGRSISDTSSIHLSVNNPDINKIAAHELGHHVLEHANNAFFNEKGLNKRDLVYNVGYKEGEADNFANSNSSNNNLYSHAATEHLNGSCTKAHGKFSHQILTVLGTGYLDSMKKVNPKLHEKLTNNDY